jgi:large subunit ribosomal protein L16
MLSINNQKLKYKKKKKNIKIHNFYFKSKNNIYLSEYIIKNINNMTLTIRNINYFRQLIKKFIKKTGKVYIKTTNIIPITKKSLESRMGSGVGKINEWIIKIPAGSILFEFSSEILYKFVFEFFLTFVKKSCTKLKLISFKGFKYK